MFICRYKFLYIISNGVNTILFICLVCKDYWNLENTMMDIKKIFEERHYVSVLINKLSGKAIKILFNAQICKDDDR